MAMNDLKVAETRKITKFLLRSLSSDCIENITHLDLSNLHLRGICGLNYCTNLETVLLYQNQIDYVPDLGNCKRLWKVDLSNNQVKVLNGFQYNRALGVLNLAGNELSWTEVIKLRDVEIVSLFLGGNKALRRDVHYRKHIVDCLPKIWFLDGQCITWKERQQVEEFFEISSLSKTPVRHKVQDSCFTPTSKAIFTVNGFDGNLQENLYKEFARDERHDIYLDWKRLYYLAGCLGDNVNLYSMDPHKDQGNFQWILNIEVLPAPKPLFSEKVLFVFLACTLVFELPYGVIKDVFSSILNERNTDEIIRVFQATTEMKFYFVFLLYAKFKLINLDNSGEKENTTFFKICGKVAAYLSGLYSRRGVGVTLLPMLQHSIACFFVLIVALLPNLEALLAHSSIINLLQISTKDALIGLQLQYLRQQLVQHFGDQGYPTELISKYILERVNRTALKAKTGCLCWFYRCILDKRSDLYRCTCQYFGLLSKGYRRQIIDDNNQLPQGTLLDTGRHASHLESSNLTPRRPEVGDDVAIDVQSLGRILAIPDEKLVLVNIDHNAKKIGRTVTSKHSIFKNFCYVDKNSLSWDYHLNCWKYCQFNQTGTDRRQSLDNWQQFNLVEKVPLRVSVNRGQPLKSPGRAVIPPLRCKNSDLSLKSSASDRPTPATNKLAIYIPSPLTETSEEPSVDHRTSFDDRKQITSLFTNGKSSLKLIKHSLMTSPENQGRIQDLKLTYSSVSLNKNSRSRLSNWLSF